ncbi:Triple functional domain protein [Manis javanica]|nr:Triple functional domain protein [Manis javanica]
MLQTQIWVLGAPAGLPTDSALLRHRLCARPDPRGHQRSPGPPGGPVRPAPHCAGGRPDAPATPLSRAGGLLAPPPARDPAHPGALHLGPAATWQRQGPLCGALPAVPRFPQEAGPPCSALLRPRAPGALRFSLLPDSTATPAPPILPHNIPRCD